MGATSSIIDNTNNKNANHADNITAVTIETTLKKLPEAIEEATYVHERFPLIIDESEQAARFLKYQNGPFVSVEDPVQGNRNALNRALVSSLQNGRTFTLKVADLEGLDEKMFENKLFPVEVLSREKFFNESVWQSVLKPSLGDPIPSEAEISSEFVFIICTTKDKMPDELRKLMCVIKVVEKPTSNTEENNNNNNGGGDPGMNQIAEMYGAKEIVRNSAPLVEAAFDGDLDEVKAQIQKGYHLDSVDGRKNTALSEAASQGRQNVVEYLLENGADPNALSDTGRSALWRAAFNQHTNIVRLLLEAGCNPEYRDTQSMDKAFDVAQTEELRTLLSEWDINRTHTLMETRRRIMMDNLEARIKTSAEREYVARDIIRKELVSKAETGDTEGIKTLLTMISAEAEKTNERPRATVEVRNNLGQSLLSIAAQRDDLNLATFLLTYWKTLDVDNFDADFGITGELNTSAKVFKANPNSRDHKGWTCVCIAVFHESRKVLPLLLENGGDPNIRSSYNRNAWDLAKDELDAALNIVKSHAEIRQILIDNDKGEKEGSQRKRLFGNGKAVRVAEGNLYEGLGDEGSPVVMNIEMNKEMAAESKAASTADKSETSNKKGKGGAQKGKKGRK